MFFVFFETVNKVNLNLPQEQDQTFNDELDEEDSNDFNFIESVKESEKGPVLTKHTGFQRLNFEQISSLEKVTIFITIFCFSLSL